MELYAIECIKEDKGKHRVAFSDGTVYEFYKEEVLEYFLYDPSFSHKLTSKEIIYDVNVKRARRVLIKYLSYSIRTEQELYRRLEKENYDSKIIEDVIAYVREKGYIDDEDYAIRYVRTSLKTKLESRNVCMNKLIEKGISKDKAYEACLLIDDKKQIEKLLLKDSVRNREYMKLKKYLYGKGFSLNDINKVIGEKE